MITEEHRTFLERRKRLVSSWKFLAMVLLSVLAGLLTWMFIKAPYLANPLFVAEALKNDTVKISILELSAMILPVVTVTLFFLIAVFIFIGFSVVSNEKKYLEIIEKLMDRQQ